MTETNEPFDDAELEEDAIEVEVHLSREYEDQLRNLRSFRAEISAVIEDAPVPVVLGGIQGWMTWDVESGFLTDAGDAVSNDAHVLTEAAGQIAEEHDRWDAVVLINRMNLAPAWRGRRLTGVVVDRLLDLLQLEPTETVVALVPEPQDDISDGWYDDGPIRDEALARLRAAYQHAGFEQWAEGPVWWRAAH